MIYIPLPVYFKLKGNLDGGIYSMSLDVTAIIA